MMLRLIGSIVGALALTGLVWMAYRVRDPEALADAQAVLLFIAAVLAGALAGDAVAQWFARGTRKAAQVSGAFIRNGVLTLLIVVTLAWVGSTDMTDIARRLLSLWCLIPTLIGVAQLGLGFRMRHVPQP